MREAAAGALRKIAAEKSRRRYPARQQQKAADQRMNHPLVRCFLLLPSRGREAAALKRRRLSPAIPGGAGLRVIALG